MHLAGNSYQSNERWMITRPVHLRRNVEIWTVIMVPTVITPYSTVQITVSQYYRVRPYKTVPPHSTILTVIWPFGSNFDPKSFISFCNNCLWWNTLYQPEIKYCVRLLNFHASYCWALPPSWCSQQPSLRVVQGSIVWRQHIRGACWRCKWEVFGAESPFWGQLCTGSASPRANAAPTQPQDRSGKHCVASAHGRSTPGNENGRCLGWRGLTEAIFATAVPAWHRTVHRTVNCRNYSKLRSSKIAITP